MSLSNLESQLTPSIIKWCNLEELIYYLIDENVDSAKNLISQFDDSERDSLFQLVQSAAEATRMHFYNSGEIWKSIGKPNHAFENTYFIEYLYHQKILDKEYLEWPCRTNPIDDPESLFYGSDTIEHALMKHDFERVVYLSADINPSTKYYYNFMQISLLEFAAVSGDVKSFKYFLVNGYSLQQESVPYAIIGGNMEIIELYQQGGFDFSKHLDEIIKYNRNSLFRWLLTENDLLKSGNSYILQICCDSHNTLAFMYFAHHMKDFELDLTDPKEWTPLLAASYNGCIEEVKYLLTRNVDINKMTIQQTTSIEIAARKGFYEIFQILKKAGSTLVFNLPRRNTLQMAIRIKYVKLCLDILKMNPDLTMIRKSSSYNQLINLLKQYVTTEDDEYAKAFLENHQINE